MTELETITAFINSPAFALMSESVKAETYATQKKLAIAAIQQKIDEFVMPIIKENGLNLSVSIQETDMQEEMKQKLQQLIDEESGKNKEELINKISSVVSPVLMDAGIQIALLVTYDKTNGVSVRELTPEVQEALPLMKVGVW